MQYFSAVPGAPLPFAACENFRELGGYTGLNGKKVRRGVLYRGPALENLTAPEDRARFEALGVRTVLDFRSAAERAARPDPAFTGAKNIAVSALTGEDGGEVNFDLEAVFASGEAGVQKMMDFVEQSYARMPFGNAAYVRLFALLEQGRVPLYFHCTAGKDRTGVAAALILTALGVSRQDVVRDYLATNECRARGRAQLEQMLAGRVGPASARRLAALAAGVKRESIELALDAVAARYSSFEAYLFAECGVGPSGLARIRADYLV